MKSADIAKASNEALELGASLTAAKINDLEKSAQELRQVRDKIREELFSRKHGIRAGTIVKLTKGGGAAVITRVVCSPFCPSRSILFRYRPKRIRGDGWYTLEHVSDDVNDFTVIGFDPEIADNPGAVYYNQQKEVQHGTDKFS